MKAMVLAAGKGTRLFPLTGEIPKPLAPVVNTPIIEHIFDLLARHGVAKSYVNVHYLADALLKAYDGEESYINAMSVHLLREKELTGTAGGVKHLAKIASKGSSNETFIVVSGDALTDIDLKELLSFQEKPDPREAISTLANTGIYIFEPEVLEYIPEGTFFDFARDVFPRLLWAGERFVGYEGEFYWSDIGTVEAYRQAQHDVLLGKVRVKVPGQKRGETLWVEKNAQIHPSAALTGYVVVGRDAVIGRDVALWGDVTVGADCWVHPNATIKSSILLPGSSVGEGAYLEDCIVGHGYDVRPGDTIRGGALIRRMSSWT